MVTFCLFDNVRHYIRALPSLAVDVHVQPQTGSFNAKNFDFMFTIMQQFLAGIDFTKSSDISYVRLQLSHTFQPNHGLLLTFLTNVMMRLDVHNYYDRSL